jgi:hypothetical protein
MKRIIVVTLSTLVLSALVAPSAKAIRPELLPQPVQSATPTQTTTPSQPQLTETAPEQKTTLAPMPNDSAKMVQPQPSEESLFYYFEALHREKYGL